MMFFKSLSKNTVTIFESEFDTEKNGTTLDISSPLMPRGSLDGRLDDPLFLHCWSEQSDYFMRSFDRPNISSYGTMLRLRTSHNGVLCDHPDFILLRHRIQSKEAQWGTSLRPLGESCFLDGYWDLLEDVLGRAEKVLKVARLYDVVFASLFHYDREMPVIKVFCEFWCPATNTLHTSHGEMTISLWDLYKLGGLLIIVSLYDETVPTLGELAGTNKGDKPFPPSCQFLFLAYHRLYQLKKKSSVKLSSWIDFWYKGKIFHTNMVVKNVRNKSQGPKDTYNPSGVIPRPRPRTDEEQAVFDDLGIPLANQEETYLAAFLSCWLCKFVFPGGIDHGAVRPSVFKIAGLMARGSVFSLGVPVLTNLYYGLNRISSSKDPGNCSVVMPYHYLYGWLGEYFNTHFAHTGNKKFPIMVRYSGKRQARLDDDARALFLSLKEVSMNRWSRIMKNEIVLNDDGNLSYNDLTYFISMWSHFLATRLDDYCMIQPYSPERFARQFGYQQHYPYHLTEDIRMIPLEAMHNQWILFLSTGRRSTVTLPSMRDLQEFQVFADYLEWWSKVCKPDEDPSMKSSKPKNVIRDATYNGTRISPIEIPRTSREKVVDSDIFETQDCLKRKKSVAHRSHLRNTSSSSTEDCHFKRKRVNVVVPTNDRSGSRDLTEFDEHEVAVDGVENENIDTNLDRDCPKSPIVSKVKESHSSTNDASLSADGGVDGVSLADVLLETKRHMASIIEDKVKNIVLQSLPESLPSIMSGLDGFYEAILRNGVDHVPLKTKVGAYIVEVNKLLSIKSVCSEKMSRKAATESLAKNASDMKKVSAVITKKSDNCKTLEDRVVAMESKKAELIAQLDSVRHSLVEEKSELSQHQDQIIQLRKERELLKSTPVLTPDEDKLLATYEKKIEDLQANFRSST